jgi:PPM family protein phosphatase
MTLIWQVAGNQTLGKRRRQEDRFVIRPRPDGVLAVVADGMGGHLGGAVASQIVVEAFLAAIDDPSPHEDAAGVAPVAQRLGAGIEAATGAVIGRIAGEPRLRDMGSTLVAVIVEGHRLHWVSVGDSLLWLLDRGVWRRLNADHSMRPLLEAMVKDGRLRADEAARHPSRNALRSVITRDPPPMIDTGTLELRNPEQTQIVLASDGIESIAESAMVDLLAGATSAEAAVAHLLRAVDRAAAPAQDNTTVIVIRPQAP